MYKTKLLTLLTAGVALAAAFPAAASVTISTGVSNTTLAKGGSGTTIYFNGQANGTVVSGVSSNMFLQLTSQTLTSATFDFVINNTSITNTFTPATTSNLSGFGFDSSPDILSGSTTDALYSNTSSGSISNGMKVEFCFTAGPNCAGGANGGISAGQTTNGKFTLNYTTLPSAFTLSNFIVRYQNLPQPAGSGIGIPVPGAVPEPATWAMMLIGFGAMGVSLRRSRHRLSRDLRVA